MTKLEEAIWRLSNSNSDDVSPKLKRLIVDIVGELVKNDIEILDRVSELNKLCKESCKCQ